MCGAAASLSKKDSTNRTHSFWFFTWTCAVALIGTVPIAKIISSYQEAWEIQFFLAPVAFGLSYLGDRWENIFSAAGEFAKSWIAMWINRGSSGEKKE